ncbi:alpha/beta hydrolase family protein [Phytohabitans flavus]|uniref:alpha/beta hydrolase family protein n=1 Tax=Phytohabitans flavus TaxID=1076124 RepID=UPI0036409703
MTRYMRTTAGVLVGALAAGAVAFTAPAVADDRQRGTERGRIVAVQPLRTLTTKDDVARVLAAAEFKTDEVRYGVDTYQLIYRTVDPAGQPTVASGLVALPRGGARELTTVSYTHGTEINRTDAPSMWRDGWAVGPALTYASAGFAAVAPDYLGLGLGPGPHPFLDVPSETTAALDLLRAAREFVPRAGHTLDRKVLVTGFSQGGTAATGLARALAGGADGWFRLGALSPIAGAYDARRELLPPWTTSHRRSTAATRATCWSPGTACTTSTTSRATCSRWTASSSSSTECTPARTSSRRCRPASTCCSPSEGGR